MASIKQLDERRYKITVSNGYREETILFIAINKKVTDRIKAAVSF